MTENNYCKDCKCSQKKHKFNIKTRFINNKGSILPFDTIAQEGGESIPISKVSDLLNELHEENEGLIHHLAELQGQNEILKKENEDLKAIKEFWKGECLSTGSLNQILTNELDIAQKQGYEPTNSFKQHIIGLIKEDGEIE